MPSLLFSIENTTISWILKLRIQLQQDSVHPLIDLLSSLIVIIFIQSLSFTAWIKMLLNFMNILFKIEPFKRIKIEGFEPRCSYFRWEPKMGKRTGASYDRGYKVGSKRVRKLLRMQSCEMFLFWRCIFSTENWSRTPDEVTSLFNFMRNFLIENLQQLMDDGVKLQYLGRIDRLPKSLGDEILHALDQTKRQR